MYQLAADHRMLEKIIVNDDTKQTSYVDIACDTAEYLSKLVFYELKQQRILKHT